MAALKLAAAALALLAPVPAAAEPVDRWAAPIAEASARFGVPADWIRRVMDVESGGRTTIDGRFIRSRAGAIGLMQLMPATWRDMRVLAGLGSDPNDPRDNILAGTLYLRLMFDRFGYPGLFAAYNAGPARYATYRTSGRPLPLETRLYVARLAGRSTPSGTARPGAPPPSLFVQVSQVAVHGMATARPVGLFVLLQTSSGH